MYFKTFLEDYVCEFHDIGKVDIKSINENDWVIIGGGGLFEQCEGWNKNINMVLSKCKNVVSWGCGKNSHFDKTIVEIEYDKFKLLSTRDFGFYKNLNEIYMPCVSCMNPCLSKTYFPRRSIGVIEHKEFPICEFDYDRISNSCSFEAIITFIGESDIIITNTYHAAYWSMLMGRKTILYNQFSDKFDYFEHKPAKYTGNLDEDISLAKIYPEYLYKCRERNLRFFEKIMEEISKTKGDDKNVDTRESIIFSEIRKIITGLKNKRVVVCGTGVHTNMLKPLLDQEGINIVAFTSNEHSGGLFDRKASFLKKSELNRIEFDIVLISSFLYREEMKNELQYIDKSKILDIYEQLEKKGIRVNNEFYLTNRVKINL